MKFLPIWHRILSKKKSKTQPNNNKNNLISMTGPNKKKIPVFRVTDATWIYCWNLECFAGILEKKIQFYAFWKAICLSKCIKLYFFHEKKNLKKMCAYPT